jgi:hypothetical protein
MSCIRKDNRQAARVTNETTSLRPFSFVFLVLRYWLDMVIVSQAHCAKRWRVKKLLNC